VQTTEPSHPQWARRGESSAPGKVAARPSFCLALAGLFLLSPLFVISLHAQKADKTAATRKLVSQVEAEYPPDLKRALIGGVVRLNIVVTARGTVDYVQVAGGNPILADAAVKAVKQWKYSPGPTTTNIRVNVTFDPTR